MGARARLGRPRCSLNKRKRPVALRRTSESCDVAAKAVLEHQAFELPNKVWSKEDQTPSEYKRSSLVYTTAFDPEHGFPKKPSVPMGAPPSTKRLKDKLYVAAAVKFELDQDVDSVDPDAQWLELGVWTDVVTNYKKKQEAVELQKSAHLHSSNFKRENATMDEKKLTTSLIKSFFKLKGGSAQTAAVKPNKSGGKWSHTYECKFGGSVNIFDAKDEDTPPTSGTNRFKTWMKSKHPAIFELIEPHLPKKTVRPLVTRSSSITRYSKRG